MKKSSTSPSIKQRSWNSMSQMLDVHMPVAAPVPFLKRWYSLLVSSILLVALGYYFGRIGQFDLNAAIRYETRFVDSVIYHHEYIATEAGAAGKTEDAHQEDDERNGQGCTRYQQGQYPRSMAFSFIPMRHVAMPPFPATHTGATQNGSRSSRFNLGTSGNTASGNSTNTQSQSSPSLADGDNANPQWREKLNMKLSEPAPNMANTTMAKGDEVDAESQLPKPYEKPNKDELVADANKQKAKDKKKFTIEPKDIADIYKSRNFKVMYGLGTTYIPGGSLGYYGELGLSKRIFKRFYLGIHFRQMNIRGTDIASFQSNRMTHNEMHYTENATLKSSSWAKETLTISEADMRQTGFMFQYEISPKLSINASYLVMNVRRFNFVMNSTHIDSSHVYLNGEEIEARRDKVYSMESGGERSGSTLQEYNMRQVGSLELGFDYQLTNHLSWNATFGTSIDNPFPVPLYWYGSEVNQGFGWLKRPEDIRYIKTGIRIHL